MDTLTLLGLLLAAIAVFGGQFLEGGSISTLLNFPAFIIVIGGTLGAVFVQTPLDALKRAVVVIRWCFVPPKMEHQSAIDKIVRWSTFSRKHGLIGLENELKRLSFDFEKRGLMLLIDGNDSSKIKASLLIDLEITERNNLKAVHVYQSLGGYAPTLGILGAVMGLIHVMGNLSEPALLGSGIATAFVATIYGVGFANLLFLPIAGKIKSVIAKQSIYCEMFIAGVTMIAEGENPKVIRNRLESFQGSGNFK